MVITRIYKDGDVWRGDIAGPIRTYPKTGVLIIDSSEIPDGPTPPPVEDLTAVDNIDPSMQYDGSWFSGPTTAEGFHDATMAYSNVAGDTLIFKFTGTYLEVFCEKKLGNGSGAFKVDALPTETINLGVAGSVAGSESVFKVDNLPEGEHTLEIEILGTGYLVFDYVKINGLPLEPPDIVFPPGSDVVVQPGQSIKQAVEATESGKTVLVKAGNYNEPNMSVPVGVNIIGEGTVKITATTPGGSGDNETGLFMAKSSSRVDGNQIIENLTLEGNNVGYGGVLLDNRNKVKLKNLRINNFNFTGVWLKNTKDTELTDSNLYNTAWASEGYSSGQVNVFALENVSILRNVIRSDKDRKGTGIEALWKESTMKNLKIMHNQFRLSHLNPWGNYQAKNFSIEIHDTHYDGLEIAFNDFGNQLSMASHKKATTPAKCLIHDNTGDLGGDTLFLENIADNFEVYNNNIKNALMFAGNFQPNSVWDNNLFHHNNFESSGPVSWGGIFLIGALGVTNFVIRDNTIKLNGNQFITYMGVTGGVTEYNNIKNP